MQGITSCGTKSNRFIVVLAICVLLTILACQSGSAPREDGVSDAVQDQPTNTLERAQILEDFRRLRKGCLLGSAVEDSGEPLETPLAVILSEFSFNCSELL
jgi:hypothetical protein